MFECWRTRDSRKYIFKRFGRRKKVLLEGRIIFGVVQGFVWPTQSCAHTSKGGLEGISIDKSSERGTKTLLLDQARSRSSAEKRCGRRKSYTLPRDGSLKQKTRTSRWVLLGIHAWWFLKYLSTPQCLVSSSTCQYSQSWLHKRRKKLCPQIIELAIT